LAVHGGGDADPGRAGDRGASPAIEPSSVYTFPDLEATRRAFAGESGRPIYARFGNPTVEATERHLAALDGAETAALFSSGMAAIALTVLALCGENGHAVVCSELYGGTVGLFRELERSHGLAVTWVGAADLHRAGAFQRDTTRVVFLESPTNPLLRVIEFDRMFASLRSPRPVAILDGTFATPLGQRGLEHGFDLIVHSATKYLGGHDDLTAGVLSGRAEPVEAVRSYRRVFGATAEPQTAWLLRRGLKTLAVRWERQCDNAQIVAERLVHHPAVHRVYYPGLAGDPGHGPAQTQMRSFGAVVAFEVAGEEAGAERVYDALRLVQRAPSLGGVESMILHPATSSHRSLSSEERAGIGITGGLLRLSLGIEDVEDIWADLEGALPGP
jgi:cystathionine beta-lyase/cystathionine gamma-synthase